MEKENISLQNILNNNILVEYNYDLYFKNQKSIGNGRIIHYHPIIPSVWILKQDAVSGNWSRSVLCLSINDAEKYIYTNREEKMWLQVSMQRRLGPLE